MTEHCPDEMERGHRIGLPDERITECEGCGKMIDEWYVWQPTFQHEKEYLCKECYEEKLLLRITYHILRIW